MKPPKTQSRRPTFRWGDVEEWVRTLSGPKIEELYVQCIGLIARFEFARTNPALIWKFDDTPDLNDGALSLEFVKFKRRLKIDYNAEAQEYVLNFAFDPNLEAPKKRRRQSRGREGKSGSGAAAQAAATRRPRRRRRIERVLSCWYKTRLRADAIGTEFSDVIRTMRTKGATILKSLQATAAQLVHRSPQLRLDAARIRDFFIDISQPLTHLPEAGARLAPRAFSIGVGVLLLFHSFVQDSRRIPWELSLFGELPRESEQLAV